MSVEHALDGSMPGPVDEAGEAFRYADTLKGLAASAESRRMSPATLAVAYEAREDALLAVHVASRLLMEQPWDSPVRLAAQAHLDWCMVTIYKAKWHLGRYDGTFTDFVGPSSDVDLAALCRSFRTATERCIGISRACMTGTVLDEAEPLGLERRGTEIWFADGVPLVPTICPVVVLAGSNRDMGRQYAQQVIDVYGTWIFERLSQRDVTAEEEAVVSRWAAELQESAPGVLEFAEGWSEGAQQRGVPLTREQAIAIWTGYREPSTSFLMFGEDLGVSGEQGVGAYLGTEALSALGELPERCSGACAWGAATSDGGLVAASTTDHECTYQATIVAYPQHGNSFIYTPFSANGSTPVLGRQFMAGHPGFNDKGVAYVHHGGHSFEGGSCGGGPFEEWGYGIRRGASTFHALQFSNSAAEARDMQLNLPVGDPGPILGTGGGMYADADYGVVLEERAGSPVRPAPILREATYDSDGVSHSFLYANNNPLSPDPGSWVPPREGNYTYSPDAGWHITRREDAGTDDPGRIAARMATKNSAGRNRYFYQQLMAADGKIDMEYMTRMYQQSGSLPEGRYENAVARWEAGEEWEVSSAHRANAFTAVIKPSPAEPGIYQGCIGPAARDLQVREPSHGYYYYDETNAFWTLRLAPAPEEMLLLAQAEASERIEAAERSIRSLDPDQPGTAWRRNLLRQAHEALAEGLSGFVRDESGEEQDSAMADLARRVRAFTRAQVRAAQVTQELPL